MFPYHSIIIVSRNRKKKHQPWKDRCKPTIMKIHFQAERSLIIGTIWPEYTAYYFTSTFMSQLRANYEPIEPFETKVYFRHISAIKK